jgi:hypothetical protein
VPSICARSSLVFDALPSPTAKWAEKVRLWPAGIWSGPGAPAGTASSVAIDWLCSRNETPEVVKLLDTAGDVGIWIGSSP